MNPISPITYVAAAIISTVSAQIFLKIAASHPTHHTFQLKWFFYIFLSLFSYLIAFFGYYMALRYFDISKVSPVMMASVVSLVALYGFAVGESFNHLKLSGIILAIISGVPDNILTPYELQSWMIHFLITGLEELANDMPY